MNFFNAENKSSIIKIANLDCSDGSLKAEGGLVNSFALKNSKQFNVYLFLFD